MSLDFVQQTEQDGAYSCCVDAGVEKELWAYPVEMLAVYWTNYKYY